MAANSEYIKLRNFFEDQRLIKLHLTWQPHSRWFERYLGKDGKYLENMQLNNDSDIDINDDNINSDFIDDTK